MVSSSGSVHPRACGEQPQKRMACEAIEPVHPRACGEQSSCSARCRRGSSPHLIAVGTRWDLRFIPAPAGNRQRNDSWLRPGEQPKPLFTGSSPRLRGTVMSHAGPAPRTVHPRACGEQIRCVAESHWIPRFIPAPAGNSPQGHRESIRRVGSSPRLRGTVGPVMPIGFPAVHPRACGEQIPGG